MLVSTPMMAFELLSNKSTCRSRKCVDRHALGSMRSLMMRRFLVVSEIEDKDLRASLAPFVAELTSFALYLDYTDENHLPLPWAVGAFTVEPGKHTFMRFYDFLETVPAHVLVTLLPAAGAQSDLILSVIPYSLETNRLIFAIADYDLGFHNRIG